MFLNNLKMKIDIFLQMKINLIVNQEDFNSNLDANILNFLNLSITRPINSSVLSNSKLFGLLFL